MFKDELNNGHKNSDYNYMQNNLVKVKVHIVVKQYSKYSETDAAALYVLITVF